ncbi:hypothetical protein KAW50_03485 [candidate division WOR-3 bacterium]|nr:hypothetical protein [candidate division WOR-3 bacterium]
MIKQLEKKYGWHFDPPLSVKVFERMKYLDSVSKLSGQDEVEKLEVIVVDKKGNHTLIEYGDNGYDNSLGFRFDSGCNHSDESQFRFFDIAIKLCQAEIKSYDGGSLGSFEEWQSKQP